MLRYICPLAENCTIHQSVRMMMKSFKSGPIRYDPIIKEDDSTYHICEAQEKLAAVNKKLGESGEEISRCPFLFLLDSLARASEDTGAKFEKARRGL